MLDARGSYIAEHALCTRTARVLRQVASQEPRCCFTAAAPDSVRDGRGTGKIQIRKRVNMAPWTTVSLARHRHEFLHLDTQVLTGNVAPSHSMIWPYTAPPRPRLPKHSISSSSGTTFTQRCSALTIPSAVSKGPTWSASTI